MKGRFLCGQRDVLARAAVVVLCFTFIFTLYPMLTPEVRAWSGTTHEFVASQAIALMPHSYDWFFSTYSSTIVSYSTKPDAWKSSDPNEGYRHYYDYDLYITHTHSEQQQPANGVLPWALEDNFNMLVQYLRNSDWTHAAQLAGVICHYTGDASMPLHATSDYWLGGAHTDYETEVNGHLGEITISSYVPHELGNVFDATMATLVDSYGYTDSTHTDPTKLSYWLLQPQPFWNYDTVRSITQSRLNAAVQLTANVWYTAMVQAGTPLLIWPENGVYLFDITPTFVWTSGIDPSGVTYQIQIDDDASFSSPVYYAVDLTENTRTLPDENALALGTYFWRVRAKDGAGNVGNWSSVWTFFVCTQTSWVQTDWKGGPKPELQVGTWDSTYDNFYDNYKVDWSQAGKVTLKAFPGSQQVTENRTPPAADSYVRASSVGSNYGTSTSIYVGYSSGAQRGYVKFDLSFIPSNRMIIQAKLWVYNYSVSGGGAYVKVERVDDDSWTESGITWSSQPARTALLVSPQSVNSGTTWYSWTSSTFTSFVAAQYDGDKLVSLALIDNGENSGSNHYARFNSKEYSSGTYAPKLEVTYLNAFYENGWFESSIFDAGKVVEWRSISWSENKPSGTNIVVKARTGGDNDPRDGGWSGWYQHTNGSENTLMENGRYIQYRVELSTTDNTKTPEFFEIILVYEFDNTPPSPSLVSPENGVELLDNTPTFEWTSVTDPSDVTYQIQIDDNSDFSSLVYSAIYLADNAHTLPDASALALGKYYWYVRAKDGVGNTGPWSEEWNFTVTTSVSFTLNLRAGWNMVSFPVLPDNADPDSVFPGYYLMYRWNAASQSYVLCGGSSVEPDEPIAPGVGYWVNVLAAENVVVSGTPVDNLTLSLSKGWNLIGSPWGGASIADPDDTPDGSVLPSAFTWDGSAYELTTDLVAGAGYWVNALNDCVLRLPGGV